LGPDRLTLLDEDEKRLIGPLLTSAAAGKKGEYRGYCTRCEDPKTSKSPSASYNFNKNVWRCFSCDKGGRLTVLLHELESDKSDKPADVIDIATGRKRTRDARLPTEANILNWHKVLLEDEGLLRTIRERRGLKLRTLTHWKIGWSSVDKRYTIPVYDPDNTLISVKLYWPLAKAPSPKMCFWDAGGKIDNETSLFNAALLAQSEVDDVVYCEGELDCITLWQQGIPAVTSTGGSGGFQPEWAEAFRGKRVWIVPDDDEAGTKGALRTADMLAGIAAATYIVQLKTGIKSGDVTDFFVRLGRSAEEFNELIEAAQEYKPGGTGPRSTPQTGAPLSLDESQNPDHNGDPIELTVMVAGKAPNYIAPRRILAVCEQNKGDVCKFCPMMRHDGSRELEVAPDDPILLRFVGANDVAKRANMRAIAEARCGDRIDYTIKDEWSLEDLHVTQSVEHRSEDVQNPVTRRIFNVGTYRTGVNTTVRLVGTQRADPRDSKGILQTWRLDPVEVDIDKFTLQEEDLEELAVFQREKGQTPLDKCIEIAQDLSANVSRIYGRTPLHVAYDLVWHSALRFNLLGKTVPKGWLEAIVIGDTRTGKSETAAALAKHYNAGILKSCEGATLAGLVGGAQQLANGWMVTWGIIPLHDRRLVVLDEFSGIKDKGIIEQMSSIRSSGVAEQTKIKSEQTSARTRLIWISNDPDGKRMAETDGMDALRRLVTQPEDIARFDFGMALSNAEVPSSLINRTSTEDVEHVYTDALCSKLVMWVWSRKASDIRWVNGSEAALIAAAEEVGGRYVSSPPLVQIENIRMKLARIAVALAARTFSTDRTGQHIVVRAEHVASAVDFLDLLYGSEVFGYLRHSRRVLAARAEAESNRPEVAQYLKSNPGVLGALEALRVSGSDRFRMRDFEELAVFDPESGPVDARALVHSLLKWRMIRRLEKGYISMEPALIAVMKELEDQGL
jgi:hypothetical protein